MAQDASQNDSILIVEDKENKDSLSAEISGPPAKIFKPNIDNDPNSVVGAADENMEVTEKSPVVVGKKPRVKLSPAEKAAREKEKQVKLEARVAREREREEVKKRKEEEARKQQKTTANFLKFFTKKQTAENPTLQASSTTHHLWYKPFFIQPFMTLAKSPREPLQAVDITALEESLTKQDAEKLYLDTRQSRNVKLTRRRLRGQATNSETTNASKSHQQGTSSDPVTIDTNINSVNEVDINEAHKKNEIRSKLLQFHENYRPGYFGTFRKKSKIVGPRRPIAKDTDLMNYEVDSDDEWEEEEPGESISDSEGEENEGGQEEDDEEDDGFFVPHGYLSDDEGGDGDCREMDVSGDAEQRREVAQAKAIETELARKCQPLKPFAIGCVWTSPDGTLNTANATVTGHSVDFLLENLKLCEAVPIVPAPIEVTKSANTATRTVTPMSVSTVGTAVPPNSQLLGLVSRMPVPDKALPDLVRFVHGNTFGVKKLASCFQNYWAVETCSKSVPTSMDCSSFHRPRIAKRQLEMKIMAIAVKELRTGFPRSCWYVSRDVIGGVGLQENELPVPNHTFVAHVQSLATCFRPQVKALPVNGLGVMGSQAQVALSANPGIVNASVPVKTPIIDLTAE